MIKAPRTAVHKNRRASSKEVSLDWMSEKIDMKKMGYAKPCSDSDELTGDRGRRP
jgi:hypothetical protein